ncbi:MAG TPA: phospholipase D-like domain-containing protein [Methanomassiliicoccales archaeon]|nr:phospholipase D-like domain-containing protein [Methanomassiliicoccales archaeon]
MRAVLCFTIVMVILLAMPMMPAGASGFENEGGVMVTRVCASYPGEFITLTNHGPSRDIGGWRLSDGEGSIVINGSLVLPAGGSFTWCAPGSFFPELYPEEMRASNGDPSVVSKGNMKLADAGDQVYLFDANGTLRDLVCYGNVEPQPPWTGPPATLKKGSVLVRTAGGNGPENWEMAVPGLFSISSPPIPAQVVPLLYPDDALPELIRQIDLSRNSIELACYLVENWTLARHLAGASARGVKVTVLLEGRPVGGVSVNGAAIAYHLQDSGAEVWTMRSADSFRRYDYLHAKYVVFDRERLFVASENMADSSFGSNRGWAVLVESARICSYAEDVFRRDLAAQGVDVFPLNTSLARAEGGPGRLLGVMPPAPAAYPANASLLTSPYGLQDELVKVISGAQKHVLVQQMRIEEDWLDGSPMISALFSAAERGVKVRVQLDSGLGTEEGNSLVAETLEQRAREERWDLECRLTGDLSPFGRLHNKGVIVDDTVVVGSANWVDGSMERNREMAVVLRSAELADIFVQWFEEDWKGDASPPVIVLPWHYTEAIAGEPVVLDATGCYDGSGVANVTWDLDGDGLADLWGPMQVMTLREGQHNITLRVEDSLGNVASDHIIVYVKASSTATVPWLLYAPLPLIFSFILLRRWSRRL